MALMAASLAWARFDELLSAASTNRDFFMAEALTKNLDYVERIDRLTRIAEDRRNASLTEIEPRRAVLGTTLRRSVDEIEAEFEVVETTPARKKTQLDKRPEDQGESRECANRSWPRARGEKRPSPWVEPSSLFQSSFIRGSGSACARNCRPDATAEIQELARQIAEPQLDLKAWAVCATSLPNRLLERLSRKRADETQIHGPPSARQGARRIDRNAGEIPNLDAARAAQARIDSFSRG
jgi:hypothetical protein